MKKLVLLICVFAFTLTSCSKDDEPTNPIVGVWKYYKYFENGVELALEECENEVTLIFSPDGTYSTIVYDFNGTDCELGEQTSGTWIGQGNLYTITIEGVAETELVTFENNTFYIEYNETSGGIDPVIITSRDVFIKQ